MNYLPTTYNPYGYGNTNQLYQNMSGMQNSYAQQPQTQQTSYGLNWVDGEVGAKAYQMPSGWPANQPIALWDTNDTVIYLKSINPMGMPNPLQKAHYKLEGVQTGEKSSGFDGTAKQPDMSEYVRKEDLERMKQDLIDTIGQMNAPSAKRPAKGD